MRRPSSTSCSRSWSLDRTKTGCLRDSVGKRLGLAGGLERPVLCSACDGMHGLGLLRPRGLSVRARQGVRAGSRNAASARSRFACGRQPPAPPRTALPGPTHPCLWAAAASAASVSSASTCGSVRHGTRSAASTHLRLCASCGEKASAHTRGSGRRRTPRAALHASRRARCVLRLALARRSRPPEASPRGKRGSAAALLRCERAGKQAHLEELNGRFGAARLVSVRRDGHVERRVRLRRPARSGMEASRGVRPAVREGEAWRVARAAVGLRCGACSALRCGARR